MPQSKDFVPEVEWFPHLFSCFPSIPHIIEERHQVKDRMKRWIERNKVDIISIETLPFEYGDGLFVEEARFRVWYRCGNVEMQK